MVSRKPHPAELRERAVQMVFEVRAETGNECNTRVLSCLMLNTVGSLDALRFGVECVG
jgi:hypothetical protein